MEVLRHYLVRLYRHEPDGMAGTVESVETGEVAPFRSAGELWAALLRIRSSRRSSSNHSLEEDGE
jgi:hypothetical protein